MNKTVLSFAFLAVVMSGIGYAQTNSTSALDEVTSPSKVVSTEELERTAIQAGIDSRISPATVVYFLEWFRTSYADRVVPFAEWRFAVLDYFYKQGEPYPAATGFLRHLREHISGSIDTGFLAKLRKTDFGDSLVQKIGGDIKPPRAISQPLPRFSNAARQARIEGIVHLRCVILEDGTVTNCKIVRPAGYGLDEAAILTIQNQWRFEPAKRGGIPVPAEANIEISMRLY